MSRAESPKSDHDRTAQITDSTVDIITQKTAFKRVAFGFAFALVLCAIGYWADSEGIILLAFYGGHGILAWSVASLAEAKGYQGGMYFIIAIFLSFFVGIIVVLMLPNKARKQIVL